MAAPGIAVQNMLISKSDLIKPLKILASFDSKGAPYIAIQLQDGQKPLFFRSNSDGIIQSKNFGGDGISYVSIEHFTNCLKSLPEDSVELGINERGIMRLHGPNVDFGDGSIIHVHTVSEGQAGLKHHDVGAHTITANPQAFLGLDIKHFQLVNPPVLSSGKLMFATNRSAIVMWNGGEALKNLPEGLSPRESFLRIVTSQLVDELVITGNGYWGAIFGDTVTYSKGHVLGKQLFDTYNVSGVSVAQLPAERLLAGLGAAVGLLSDTDRLDIDPKLGVVAKGSFGDNRNSLGETGNWAKFGLRVRTAKVIIDALSQTTDDYVILESMTGGTAALMRLRRGAMEVSFRSY